jgi:hypothetical protein
MSSYMQPQIILLREGTDTSQGKGQLISNINACSVSPFRTTFAILQLTWHSHGTGCYGFYSYDARPPWYG